MPTEKIPAGLCYESATRFVAHSETATQTLTPQTNLCLAPVIKRLLSFYLICVCSHFLRQFFVKRAAAVVFTLLYLAEYLRQVKFYFWLCLCAHVRRRRRRTPVYQ